jgi:hypothetical protein
VTDGGFTEDGVFRPLANWDGEALMRPFRERLLGRLVEKHTPQDEQRLALSIDFENIAIGV